MGYYISTVVSMCFVYSLVFPYLRIYRGEICEKEIAARLRAVFRDENRKPDWEPERRTDRRRTYDQAVLLKISQKKLRCRETTRFRLASFFRLFSADAKFRGDISPGRRMLEYLTRCGARCPRCSG